MGMVKRGRSWFGVDRQGRRSFKGGVDCDILAYDLIALIEYLYNQDVPSFLEAQV
jgi:hypothetical protein